MTYPVLAGLLVVLAAVPFVLVVATRRPPGFVAAVAVTGLALVVMTVVFDSLMIAADLFRYGPDLLGPIVWLAPVEDLAWPVATALGLPALWVLLTPRAEDAP
jgi:hypothetical protein